MPTDNEENIVLTALAQIDEQERTEPYVDCPECAFVALEQFTPVRCSWCGEPMDTEEVMEHFLSHEYVYIREQAIAQLENS